MLNHKENNSIPELNPEAANQLLNNVFLLCEQTPNTIPIDHMAPVTSTKTTSFKIGQILSIVFFIIILLLPLCFLSPTIDISSQHLSTDTKDSYTFTVHTMIPVTEVTATLNSVKIPITSNGNNSFTTSVTENGNLIITATTANGQYCNRQILVTDRDSTDPVLNTYYFKDSNIYIVATDAESGIAFEQIVAYTLNHTKIDSISYDMKTNTIIIDSLPETIIMEIPDKQGNVLQVTITPN